MGIEAIKLRFKCHIISSPDLKQESVLELQSQQKVASGSDRKYNRISGRNCRLGGPVSTQRKTFSLGR